MHKRQRRYSIDEIARRSSELYETKLRPLVQPGNDGRILCIDIETGEYAVADEALEASQALIDKNSEAQFWCLRIGHVAVEKFGFHDTREQRWIIGHMTARLEATVTVFVEDGNGQTDPVDAALDTGYSGYLTLPPAVIATLGLTWVFDRPFMLGNGSTTRLDVHSGVVIWDGQPRKIEIDAVQMGPVIGMKMLAGHEVRMHVVDGGRVWIDVVP